MSENTGRPAPEEDGFIKDQEGPGDEPEAGPTETRLGRKLRNLKISIDENLIEGYNWRIDEHAGNGSEITVAFGYSTEATYDVALVKACQVLLAMGEDDGDGPRVGDTPRRDLCPGVYIASDLSRAMQ